MGSEQVTLSRSLIAIGSRNENVRVTVFIMRVSHMSNVITRFKNKNDDRFSYR